MKNSISFFKYFSFLLIVSTSYGQIQFEKVPSYNNIQKLCYVGDTMWVITAGKVMQILPGGDVINHNLNTQYFGYWYMSNIFCDKQHRLWIGSEAYYKDGQWTYVSNIIDSVYFYSYSSAMDITGNIFFNTSIGILKFTGNSFVFADLPANIINIEQMQDGKIALTDSACIYTFDGTDIIDTIPFIPTAGYSSLLFSDSQNRFWCSYNTDTIAYLDQSGWHLKKIVTDFITSICEDKDHNIWFTHGCTGKGVSTFTGSEIINYSLPDGLCSEHTWALACAPDSSVKIGTWKGLSSFKSGSFSTTYFDGPLSLNTECMIESGPGHYFFGGAGAISEYNNGVWSYYSLPYYSSGNYFESDFPVRNLRKNSNGHIWAATQQLGIFEFDGSGWINHNPTTNTTNYFEMAETANHHIWAGSDSGLYEFDGLQWNNYNTSIVTSSDSVLTLQSQGDSLWVGTPAGLFIFENNQWHQTEVTEYVLKILKGQNEIFWVLTKNHVYEFDNNQFIEFAFPDTISYFIPQLTLDLAGNPVLHIFCTIYSFINNSFVETGLHYNCGYDGFTNITSDNHVWYGHADGLYKSVYTLFSEEPEYTSLETLIYPNPASFMLYLNSPVQFNSAEIIDITGSIVKKVNENEIDISNLTPGLYAIRIHTPKGIVTRKFVKE